jgi:hypothetical protein
MKINIDIIFYSMDQASSVVESGVHLPVYESVTVNLLRQFVHALIKERMGQRRRWGNGKKYVERRLIISTEASNKHLTHYRSRKTKN